MRIKGRFSDHSEMTEEPSLIFIIDYNDNGFNSKLKWSFDVFLAALDIHTGVQFFHDLLAAQSIDGGRGGV